MNHLPHITLLNTLQPLSSIINNICVAVPSITPKLGSDVLKCQGDDEIVAVWTRESKHNYDDNSNISEVRSTLCITDNLLFIIIVH